MLTTGKAKQPSCSNVNKTIKQELKPRLINVTGSQTVTRVRKNSESEPEPEDYVPAPAFNQSFSDAIALALEKSSLVDHIKDGKLS